MKKSERCAKCGACTTVCPLYQATGQEPVTARGKLHLLAKLDPAAASATYAEILSQCMLCGACTDVCSRKLDPSQLFRAARSQLNRTAGQHAFLRLAAQKVLHKPDLLKNITALGKNLLKILPAESGLRLRLGLPPEGEKHTRTRPTPRQETSPPTNIGYFSGCYASYMEPAIAQATHELLSVCGLTAWQPSGQQCCGLAASGIGDLGNARELARSNIALFEQSSTILTSCSSCYSHLRSYPELFADDNAMRLKAEEFSAKVVEFSTFFSERLPASGAKFSASSPAQKVLYHDPCHLRFGPNITAQPRTLLKLIPNLDLVEPENGPHCCGQGGLFSLAQPHLSKQVTGHWLNAMPTEPTQTVSTGCSGCLLHLRQSLAFSAQAVQVTHPALLLAEALKK